jgi:glucokinase
MFLGIEIGGTKLQLGVGPGDGVLVDLVRRDVDRSQGAAGILQQIASAARDLNDNHHIAAVGFGFGGPVDVARGLAVKSHHVSGWESFPLADWCQRELRLPAVVENDCDAAALAEARFGAGRGANPVFYVTVGTGIGGGLVVDGQIYRGSGHGAAEIGHLRPGLDCSDSEAIVEAYAAGWGIESSARKALADPAEPDADRHELLARAGGKPENVTARAVFEAAMSGNRLARMVVDRALATLGWAIAQAVTLTSPQVIVVGGGVSLAGEESFLRPLRAQVDQFVFPPLQGKFLISPAALGESVVVHGALAAAACLQ